MAEDARRHDDDFSDEPLNEIEIKRIRRIIQADDRARWLWASARTWATWITAVTVGIYAAKSAFFDLVIWRKG